MNKRMLIIVGVVAALSIQIALALFFFMREEPAPEVAGEETAETAAERKALYHNLRPPFVVTLPYGERQFMLQADLAIMAHEPNAIDAVINHGPLIRARIISYLTDLDPEAVQSKDGKQQMLDGLTELINSALADESEGAGVDSVLFNNLVMQ